MVHSLTLIAALAMTPGQGAGLNLTNPRVTFGELGSPRPDNKLLPGDIFFLSFDIEGIKVSETGRVKYGMAMEVTDATGKSIFKQMPVERDDFLPLGGTKLPARAFVSVGQDQPPGMYTCKVTVTDRADKDKPVAKALEQKFEVLPKGFGIVMVYTASDPKGEIPAPLVGVAGQALFVHFAVVEFQRTRRPSSRTSPSRWSCMTRTASRPCRGRPSNRSRTRPTGRWTRRPGASRCGSWSR